MSNEAFQPISVKPPSANPAGFALRCLVDLQLATIAKPLRPAMAAFPAGSFAYLDPSMHHYAMASGATVIQVHGMAPLQFNYINPQDDPSRKK